MSKGMKYNVAVVGATGNVGTAMLAILAERNFPIDTIHAIASRQSIGKEVSFGEERILKVKSLDDFDFTHVDIALFSPGGSVSAKYAPIAAAAGCVVIDNTSHFRMHSDIPLIVPEVNGDQIKHYKNKNIIANPNCSTIQLLMALKPLHDLAKIKRVVVATYQSVSGAGKDGMDELYEQTKAILTYKKVAPEKFSRQISFNLIPQIDTFDEDGFTKEENKMRNEVKKILSPDIEVVATCVRVPVFVGHSEAVNIEFHDQISVDNAAKALSKMSGVVVLKQNDKFSTPIDCVGEDAVYVSRLRKDPSVEHGLCLWVVADNVRKGAALNAVQIAEVLVRDYLKK